ncbi:hypothetical protein [Streptomyces hundungensis]|uniref:hypothetical protein n=1 Tax=Streptomyces hundungensis TaxID=1077946 RepID=UPI0034087732
MSQTARHEAREQGQLFAGALTWLGPDEQEEVSRHFVRHHLRLHRDMLRATVVRAEELRAEYTYRYAQLRRRVIGLAVAAVGLSAGLLFMFLFCRR